MTGDRVEKPEEGMFHILRMPDFFFFLPFDKAFKEYETLYCDR
jgi:hypothetical protein